MQKFISKQRERQLKCVCFQTFEILLKVNLALHNINTIANFGSPFSQ